MSSKKEQKSDSIKKSDKMIDTHREFLDMDTDEEDFERQESPELEEELPPEPEKPIFAEDDLLKLVKYVKHLTIFDDDWNENCDEVIREYFANPSHELLTVFHQENKLTAILNLPKYAPKGFMYFLRSPWQIYTTENFLDTVQFGSISANIKNSIFKFMENIYAPILLRSNGYTSFIKDETFSNLHEFIIRFTEEIYKPKGLTTLYIPKENLTAFLEPSNKIDCFLLGEDQKAILSEEDEKKRQMVRGLEKIVWSWIIQIHKITVTLPNRKKIKCIQDEVNYWKSKYSNLNYLRAQFLNQEVRLICNILRNFRSPNVQKFEESTKRIETEIEQVASNLKYLNVMLDFCENLNIPEDAENSITKALLLILFIWMEASSYNTVDNIETLCESFSSQIIRQCESYIKLDAVFGNDPKEGEKMLKKCIFCCNIYKIIYDNLTTKVVPLINPGKKWEINEENVFDKIDTFKRRCYSVIEICELIAIFGRHNKIASLGTPRGVEYEAYWQEIENLFYESLNELNVARHIIFDMAKSNWLKKVNRFKYMIQQLENMVINLINDIFKNVENIEEGIEAMYALQKFKKREIFRELLQKKWLQVWQIFCNEIEYCYTYVMEVTKGPESMQKADKKMNILSNSQYLERQYAMMRKGTDWIGDCPIEKCTLQKYKQVLDVIEERGKMFKTHSILRTQQ